MCDAGTIDLFGTLLQVGGQVQASRAESKALEQQAAQTRRQADFELKRLEEETEALRGRQRTAAAISGIRGAGSVLEVQQQTAEDAELEALNIQFGATAREQALLTQARQVRQAGLIGGAGTVLSGVGRRR